jgi:hypothetical protein
VSRLSYRCCLRTLTVLCVLVSFGSSVMSTKVKISWLNWDVGSVYMPIHEQVLAEFGKTHPNIEVEMVQGPYRTSARNRRWSLTRCAAPSSCCLFTSLRSFGWLAGNKAPLPPENTSTAARGSYSPVCRSAFSDLRNDYHLSRWVGLFPHPPASQIGHHDHAVADLPHDSPQRHSAPLVGP